MDETEITPELRLLISTVRTLSPELVSQVCDFAAFLASRHEQRPEAVVVEESCRSESNDTRNDADRRRIIRDEIAREPTADDREIVRRVQGRFPGSCSRGPIKSVRLEMMDRDEIPGKPWGTYSPYSIASGGNRWLPNGHMISQDEFARRRALGEFSDFTPSGDGGLGDDC